MNAFKRLAAGSAGIALAITGAAMAPANAGTTGPQVYNCVTALGAIAMNVTTTGPDTAYAGLPVAFTSSVSLDDTTSNTLRSMLGAAGMEGSGTAKFLANGIETDAPITIPRTTIPAAGPASATANGTTIPVPPGVHAVAAGNFTVNLDFFRADGSKITEGGPIAATCSVATPASMGNLTVTASPSTTKAMAKKSFKAGKAAVVNATVSAKSGLAADGAATVAVKGATKKSVKGTVKAGKVSFKVTKLKKGKYTAVVTYAGKKGYINGSKSATVRFVVK